MPSQKDVATPRCKGKRNPKRLGEHAESVFLERAIGEGFAVAKPWGESDRYDFVVDAGGRFWRIQVKSSNQTWGGRYGCYGVMAHSLRYGGGKRGYTPSEIDILAAYIAPEKLWYIIPIRAVGAALNIKIYTYARNPQNRGHPRAHNFELYREAWWVLNGEEPPV